MSQAWASSMDSQLLFEDGNTTSQGDSPGVLLRSLLLLASTLSWITHLWVYGFIYHLLVDGT